MNIELRHICKTFGTVRANDDISATFKAGRIIGILGENGAGKSTLMKILSGYQPPDSGEIWLDGRRADYRDPQAAMAAGIGMLQQDPLDVHSLTVLENFVYGGPRLSGRAARAKLADICTRFGFDLDPDVPAGTLTIGGRQQLEIARLLALGVRALILDEPTTGISAEQKALLFEAMRDLARAGMTILFVSHKLEDVIVLCDEAVVLRGGRLVGTQTMPTTTDQLVRLMFGGSLSPQARPSAAAGGEVLALDNVTLRGRRVTVERLTLRARAGEVIGLAGLDGSGQELLVRACAGLVRPTSGRVLVHGREMTGQSYRAYRQAGVAFGAAGRLEEGLIAGLTLTEHLALTTGSSPLVNWHGYRSRMASEIARYNVRGTPDSRIEALSGGNQQRVLMALLPEQPVLLALEQPTRGLDVDSARWIWQQLLARRGNGTAIVFTSPELDELVTYSDRILVFFAGRFIEVAHPASTTVDALGRLIGGDFAVSLKRAL